MRVGLISFHNAYNYGACLQAYALQEAITEMGNQCEYIDYVNARRSDGYKLSARVKKAIKRGNYKEVIKTLAGWPLVLKRGRKFDAFYNMCLKKTNKKYSICSDVEEISSKYDKFIVGSDQVWNAEHNGSDNAYFLEFEKDKTKTISYSSSFGVSSIPDELKSWYKKGIEHIGCLSTREEKGVELIRELTGREAHLVLDPVFLVDSSKWKTIAKSSTKKDDYTFYYINAKASINDFVITTGLNETRKHILSTSISVKDFLKSDRTVKFAMSPSEFLGEIEDARLVVTTSFHCIAFAIIFHKPFIAIMSGDSGRDERLLNLLRITGLESRIFRKDMTRDDIQKSIDYEDVEIKLKTYRDYSSQFLKCAINTGIDAVDKLEKPRNTYSEREQFDICDEAKCTGCGACYAICPCGAITMQQDTEGFDRPHIRPELCLKCGACRKVCQANQIVARDSFQRFYAMKNSSSVRRNSSSGGAFTAFAEEVIKRGGVVVASEMDSEWNLHHTISETQESVVRQAKTFYVQGEGWQQFKRVKELLENERPVLFVGTPCQVVGLHSYLGKEYEKLIMCDIICHGVPSPAVFHSFLEYLESRGKLEVLNHRDKDIGWYGYNVSAIINGKKYKNSGWLKSYNVMFSHGLINRPSCYKCQYTNYNRFGDVTIGDFWGIEKSAFKSFYDNLGVSLVISNNIKGDEFLHKAFCNIEFLEVSKEITLQNSLHHPQKESRDRVKCIHLSLESYEKAAHMFGEWSLKGYCKQLLRSIRSRLL